MSQHQRLLVPVFCHADLSALLDPQYAQGATHNIVAICLEQVPKNQQRQMRGLLQLVRGRDLNPEQ